jgi:hypothetical protein
MARQVVNGQLDKFPIEPRLLDLHQAGVYLGVSYWSVRDYVAQGRLRTVQMPTLTPREGERVTGRQLRRVLIDRRDLDEFIDSVKSDRRGPWSQTTGARSATCVPDPEQRRPESRRGTK